MYVFEDIFSFKVSGNCPTLKFVTITQFFAEKDILLKITTKSYTQPSTKRNLDFILSKTNKLFIQTIR